MLSKWELKAQLLNGRIFLCAALPVTLVGILLWIMGSMSKAYSPQMSLTDDLTDRIIHWPEISEQTFIVKSQWKLNGLALSLGCLEETSKS